MGRHFLLLMHWTPLWPALKSCLANRLTTRTHLPWDTITDGSLISTPTEWSTCWQTCQRTHPASMMLANISTSQQCPLFHRVTRSRYPVCSKTSSGYDSFFMRVKGEHFISHIFQLKSWLNLLWGCVKSASVCQDHGFSLFFGIRKQLFKHKQP